VIIACTKCPAEYSVPDAKIRGKKVRVTCKHCGTGIIVDGTAPLPPASPPPPVLVERVLPPFELPRALGVDDDATRVMQRTDFSVHEEPTVVGQIPIEALEAERRFAQRTIPPPGVDRRSSVPAGSRPPPPPPPPPSIVIDSTIETLPASSPSSARAAFPVPPSRPNVEAHPLTADDEDAADLARLRNRTWPWALAAALLVVLLLAVVRAFR
jgi:predicted Zn finger-like uncharacterized protein